MVGAEPGGIILPQLYSHTGVDFHGCALEVMAMAASSSRCSYLARSVSLRVVGVHRYPRWQWRVRRGGFSRTRMLYGGGESIVLLQLRRWEEILVQDSMWMSPGRRATTTYASLHAADLFIHSQSLVGDGGFL
jgi:hypothetical protein